MVTPAQITSALRQQGALLRRGEWHYRCFRADLHKNGDRKPSARWHEGKGVLHCDVCGDGGGTIALATRLGIRQPPELKPAPPQPITLEAFAERKGLRIATLRGLGWEDSTFPATGLPAIAIPYKNPDGSTFRTRWRTALDGPFRFAWDAQPSGTGLIPYGLDMLKVRNDGTDPPVLLVEGETDFATAWESGIPCLGIPGASVWQSSWLDFLPCQWLDLWVWQELDTGGETFVRKIGADASMWVIKAPPHAKDITELRQLERGNFINALNDLKRTAELRIPELNPQTALPNWQGTPPIYARPEFKRALPWAR